MRPLPFRFSVLMLNILLGSLILAYFMPALSQEDSKSSFGYELSMARFWGNDSLRFVEFYFSIPLGQLTTVPEADKFKLGFSIKLQAVLNDSVYAERTVRHPFTSETEKPDDPNRRLLSVENIFLKAGEYEMRVEVADLFGDSKKAVTFPLMIDPIVKNSLDVSDIQLASLINRDSVKTQFYKNGYKILPNVASVFGATLPALFYYAEIYNFTIDDTSRYSVRQRILNSRNEIINEYPVKLKNKPGKSAVELDRINIISLASDSYTLELEVHDLATQQSNKQQKKFFIYREKDFQESVASENKPVVDGALELFPDSRYYSMNEDELDEEFESTKYMSTKDERNTYKKLDLNGKRQYIVEFWAKRDPDVNTKKNEYRDIYLSRVKYANDHFKGFREGWKTDRGRILLIYGEPDEIERSPFSSETKPFQVWKYYSLQGGVEFIFVDKRNFGDLELVHSTARGELNDYDWQRWISTN